MGKDKEDPQGVPSDTVSALESLEAYIPSHFARGQASGTVPPLLGTCVIGVAGPGTALLRWEDNKGEPHEEWAPVLLGVAVESGDQVLLVQPSNSSQPVVVGVVERNLEDHAPTSGAHLKLEYGRALRINGSDGKPLLNIHEAEQGPVVSLAREDLTLEIPGQLRLSGAGVEIESREGDINLAAHNGGDVTVVGRFIKLN